MKKLTLLLLVIVALVSCDKVTDPIVKKDTVVGSKFITKTNASVSHFRKVLLEDYTGQRCPNCPAGSSIIKNTLVPRYGDSLVVLAIHAGFLSSPAGEFINQDFRTPAGTEWHDAFGVSQWPTGIVNNKAYPPDGILLTSTKWAAVVPKGLKDPFYLKLDLKTEYDTTVRALNTYIKAKFNMAYTGATKVAAFITEDEVVGMQDNMGVVVEEYDFEHMLRGDIGGTYGAVLTSTTIPANDSVEVAFKNFKVPEEINAGKGKVVNDKHVTVVVFAYDVATRAVLQVEKLKIR
jgi:hypothetical protein